MAFGIEKNCISRMPAVPLVAKNSAIVVERPEAKRSRTRLPNAALVVVRGLSSDAENRSDQSGREPMEEGSRRKPGFGVLGQRHTRLEEDEMRRQKSNH